MGKRAGWQRAIEAGRLWTAADAQEALAACGRSGESTVAFARRHGLNATRLYWWRQHLKKESLPAKELERARLIPVMVSADKEEPRTNEQVIVVDGALRVEIGNANAVSPAWVAALLRFAREDGA
jgi:transposase-like protein